MPLVFKLTSIICLHQHVSEPTHLHHDGTTSANDLVFTCEDSVLQSCETVPSLSNSDHFWILSAINIKIYKQKFKCKGRRIWCYSLQIGTVPVSCSTRTQLCLTTLRNLGQCFMSFMKQFIFFDQDITCTKPA